MVEGGSFMKNIIVISTSLRKNGNSERLADAFVKGAKEAGHNCLKKAKTVIILR